MSDVITEDQASVIQVVCFKLAAEEYAFDITQVQEVIRLQLITEVPQMPAFVLGVVNIRGSVVPVFDLRKKFHLPEKVSDEKTKILVVTVDGELISFIVDEILDNIKISSAQLDPAPTIKMEIAKNCVRGVGLLDGRMITILNIENVNEEINDAIETQG